MPNKIRNFTDLNTWKESHKIVIQVYSITKSFPKEEIYGLTNQMRRCAVSVTSNIAEGFSRQSAREKAQFYFISKGSLTELHNQLIIAKDVKYIDNKTYTELINQIQISGRLLTGLIRSVNSKR